MRAVAESSCKSMSVVNPALTAVSRTSGNEVSKLDDPGLFAVHFTVAHPASSLWKLFAKSTPADDWQALYPCCAENYV
jgi:hypothetical protein